MKGSNKTTALFIFAKAQAASFIGGISDYVLMVALTEWGHIHYTISILISGVFGALINFNINRYWTYKSDNLYASSISSQLLKFSFVVAGSIAFKSYGTYLVTSGLTINYKVSRLMIELLVCYAFNFPLMKYWVFKNVRETKEFAT